VHIIELFIAYSSERDNNLFSKNHPVFDELRDANQAETIVVVAIIRAVVVTVSRATILSIVVPVATAKHTVRTHD